jgi:hypothetical protein
MDDLYVTFMGLPVLEFPVELIDPARPVQVVRVPFIRIRGVTYGSGAYVQLERREGSDEFALTRSGLQPHLMMEA